MMQISEIDKATAVELWPELETWIGEALVRDEHDTITTSDIKEQLSTGYAQLMLAHSDENLEILGAIVVQMFKLRGERVIHVLTTTGVRMADWLDALIDHLRDIAQKENASAVTMSGRPGWAKQLAKYGFRTHQITMRMGVDNERRQEQAEQPIPGLHQPADSAIAGTIPAEPVQPGAGLGEQPDGANLRHGERA